MHAFKAGAELCYVRSNAGNDSNFTPQATLGAGGVPVQNIDNVAIPGDDYHNFAPSIGVSWSLPWLGKDKTVLRAGYGWSYIGDPMVNIPGNLREVAGSIPGLQRVPRTQVSSIRRQHICRWPT